MSRRAPWWFPPISFVGMAVLVCFVSFFHPFWPSALLPFSVTGQLGLLLILARAFAYWPPMARWFAAMPIPHRVVFAGLLFAMYLGHFTFNGRTYFPFVAWEIFPHEEKAETVKAYEFIGETASGGRVRLLAEQQFPSIVQIDRLEDIERSYPAGTTDALARALAKMYNAQHGADPVRQVDLMEMAVNLHPPPDEPRNEPSCELLKSYDVSSGR
jgi:hypothetical protein